MAIVDGWGRGTWGQGAWNENIPVEVTGQQLTLNLDSVTITLSSSVILTGTELTTILGQVDPSPDAFLSGTQLNLNLNGVS
jgi:hypothetical protein